MSKYSEAISKKKEIARNQLLSLIRPVTKEIFHKWGNQHVNILSLPSDNFEFEKKVRDLSEHYHIDTVENNYELWKKGLVKAQELNINHYHDDIFDFLAKSDRKYHVIWLDLCGYLNPKLMNRLIPVFQGKYTWEKAVIGLTTMQARENKLIREKKHYGFSSVSSFRIGFPKYLDYFAEQAGCKLTHFKRFRFTSANNTPMQLQRIIIQN